MYALGSLAHGLIKIATAKIYFYLFHFVCNHCKMHCGVMHVNLYHQLNRNGSSEGVAIQWRHSALCPWASSLRGKGGEKTGLQRRRLLNIRAKKPLRNADWRRWIHTKRLFGTCLCGERLSLERWFPLISQSHHLSSRYIKKHRPCWPSQNNFPFPEVTCMVGERRSSGRSQHGMTTNNGHLVAHVYLVEIYNAWS